MPTSQSQHYATADPSDSEQEASFLNNVTAWIPSLPPSSHKASVPVLTKPVVIPRIETVGKLAVPLPFMRAYSPDLRAHDIHETDFLAFVDNLSVAQAPPAPLQALNAAGHVVGVVPHHWAMLAGTGMNVVAGIGTAANSVVRTRNFMERVNREYFAPRGLRAFLCKNEQLAQRLGVDPNLPQLAALDTLSGPKNLRDRRMQALEPYIARLSFDVPPPTVQRTTLDKIAARQIERKIRKKQEKNEERASKTRRKEARRSRSQLARSNAYKDHRDSDAGFDSDSDSSSESEEESKADRRIRKISREAAHDLIVKPKDAEKIEEKRRKKFEKLERKRGEKEKKEGRKKDKTIRKDEKQAEKMEFIVIEKFI